VAVALAARYLFWNVKRDVRRRLEAIAETASLNGHETSIERTAKAARLGGFVTDDVIVRTDSAVFVGGRPAVVRFALDGAEHGEERFVCDDVQIEIVDPNTATAFFTLSIFHHNAQASDPAPRQLHVTFSKMGGQWLLSRGEVLRTLESLPAATSR
jgi:ketosteroid isomerase-like protein